MGKKRENKHKDPHSDIAGGHALFRLRQMELERGLPQSDDAPEQQSQDEDTKEGK